MTHPRQRGAGDVLDRLGGYMSPKAIGHALELIPEIEAEARQQGRDRELIDRIAVRLSQEFAQGTPYERLDRMWVARRLTVILDEFRGLAETQQGTE